ncbi:MAG: hypothetical protein A2Y33_15135 [Spirochaetes bacterium GWF1_51_8]|nr:MAG: hypothetical protein A2Y33_15135 [Spirochaetes bacterium GWF1_51_8]
MQFNKKLIFSILLLVIAGGIAVYVIFRAQKIPKFTDSLIITGDKFIIEKQYSYLYTAEYPVSVQKILLTSGITNITGIFTKSGKPLDFQVQNNRELIVFFDKPVFGGEMIELVIRAEILKNAPQINITGFGNNKYSLHYVTWERNLAKKIKKIVLPEGAVIDKVHTAVNEYEIEGNTVQFRWVFDGKQILDISVDFTLSNGTINAIPAAIPVIMDNMVKFRVPKSLVQFAPAIRGDFSLWRDILMTEEGDYYIFQTDLAPGTYRYQYSYGYYVMADSGVLERQYNNFGESYSVIIIQ